MKNVGISDDTYQAIAARTSDVSAFIEQAAKRQLAKQDGKPENKPEDLVERFRSFRGMLKNTTIDDIVAARHYGLK